MNRVGAGWLAAVVLGGASQVSLAAEDGALNRLAACSNEKNDTVRLVCYDREIAQVAPPPHGTATQQAATASVAAAKSAQENFGVQGGGVARRQRAQEKEAGSELKSLTATVAVISQLPRGQLVITLDNGQVWAQKTPQSYFPVKIGDAVEINAGALGSFRMIVSGRSTQVTRMR